MPLSDVTNAQQQTASRYKRFSVGKGSSPRVDENHAPPPARLRGFLAPTKAFSAKKSIPPPPEPAQLHSGRNTPLSALPRLHSDVQKKPPAAASALPTPVCKSSNGKTTVYTASRHTPIVKSKSSPNLSHANEASRKVSPVSQPVLPSLLHRAILPSLQQQAIQPLLHGTNRSYPFPTAPADPPASSRHRIILPRLSSTRQCPHVSTATDHPINSILPACRTSLVGTSRRTSLCRPGPSRDWRTILVRRKTVARSSTPARDLYVSPSPDHTRTGQH